MLLEWLNPIRVNVNNVANSRPVTQPEALRHLLHAVALGKVSPEEALDQLRDLPYEAIDDFARIDHHRALRTGFPEVIWGPGKTPEQIARIMETMRDRAAIVMATRIEPEVYAWIREMVPDAYYFPMARICALRPQGERASNPAMPPDPRPQTLTCPGLIGVLSAGTADLPVADEAAVTAELCGFRVRRLWDVGVSGLHRLLSNRHVLDEADVLIVVAGMEGALPSVVGGMANCPVIAVPTSIGYGASFNGLAALLAMLNACAAGIGVVNIDNGFGAAMLAGQILRTAQRVGGYAFPS